MKRGFLIQYLESIVAIIEDKPLFEIPEAIFKAVIFLSFFQISVFILESSADKNLNNEIISSVFSICKLFSLNRILILQNSDVISSIVLLLSQLSLYLYFLYVMFFTFLKNYSTTVFGHFKRNFAKINQLLNIYFCFFISIFLNLTIELSSSIMFCAPRSLFSEDRASYSQISSGNYTCSVKPWQIGIGVAGIIACFFTAVICIFFFRNFEFQESNVMKRRVSGLFMLTVILKITITFIEYSNINQSNQLIAKHILMHIFSVVSLIDASWNNPYSNNEIAKFNLTVACCFYSLVCICNFWIYTDLIADHDIFYFFFGVIVFFSGFFRALYTYTYETILESDFYSEIDNVGNSTFKHFPFDFYLEEVAKLGQISTKTEEAKCKLLKIYKIHILTCKNENCPSQRGINSDSKEKYNPLVQADTNDINMEMLYTIIDFQFKRLLGEKVINNNQNEFEHLCLKYITFMIKCLNNQIRANYELKLLMQQRIQRGNQFSLYFQIVSKIVTSDIESVIKSTNSKLLIQQRTEELTIYHIVMADELCQEFMPIFQDILREKQIMWTKLQKGYQNMNGYQNDALKLMRKISQVRDSYTKKLHAMQRTKDFTFCLPVKKLSLLYNLFVMNDNLKAAQLEQEINDLNKRDTFLEEDILNNKNLIKNNTIQISLSLSQSLGKITSKKDYKTSNFFGFTTQEFEKITKINELMPQFLSSQHDDILTSFVKRGSSKFIKSSFPTFAREKKGFIFQVKLFPDFQIGFQDDFRIGCTLLKIDKTADFILFDRSGKILGISENICHLIFVQTGFMDSLPLADALVKSLNAFTLFPHILKKLMPKKNEILESKYKFDSEIVASDDKGSISFDSEILFQAKNFGKSLERAPSIENNKANEFKRFQSSNSVSMGAYNVSQLQFQKLDVLSTESYLLYKQFEKKKRIQQQNKSSSSGLRTTNDQFTAKSSYLMSTRKYKQQSYSQSIQSIQSPKEKYRIQFKYDLSFHSIQREQHEYEIITGNKIKNNEGETNQNEDFFFSLQMKDITYPQKVTQKQSTQGQLSLPEKIKKYLMSISLIPATLHLLRQKEMNLLTGNQHKQIGRKGSEYSDFQFDRHFVIPQIPASFLVYIKGREGTYFKGKENNNYQKEHSEVVGSRVHESIDGSLKQSPSKELELLEKQQELLQTTENSLSSKDNSNQNSFDNDNQGDLFQEEMKNERKKKFISEQFEQISKGTDLDNILNNNQLNTEDFLALDPFYKAKRVLQTRTLSSKFMVILETLIVQALVEIDKERKISPQQQQHILVTGAQTTADQTVFEHEMSQNPFEDTSEIENNELTFRKNPDSYQILIPENNHLPQQNSSYFKQKSSSENENSDISPSVGDHLPMMLPNISSFGLKKQSSQSVLPTSTNDHTQEDLIPYSQSNINPQQIGSFRQQQNILNSSYDNLTTPNQSKSQYAIPNTTYQNKSFQQDTSNLLINELIGTHQSDDESPIQARKNTGKTMKQYNQSEKYILQTVDESTEFNREKINPFLPFDHHSSRKKIIKTKGMSVHEEVKNKQQSRSDETHQQVVNQLLNKVGLSKEIQNDNASLHSSTRSSSSYGGYFLKEIIQRHKVPKYAHNYSFILILFASLFLGLNIANLIIIKEDMQSFTDNTVVLRQPRKLLRDYVKSFYGFFLQIQISSGYFLDNASNEYYKMAEDYKYGGARSYNSIIEINEPTLIQYKQKQQNDGEQVDLEYYYFSDFDMQENTIDSSLIYGLPVYFLRGIQSNSTSSIQASSFLSLRSNTYALLQDVLSFSNYLINGVLTTADNLVTKFILISVAAIISMIFIPIISVPISQQINLYEEKILMVVSRITFDQSSIEKQKMAICSQLLSLDTYDWLKYTYNEVFNLRFRQFDVNLVHQVQEHSSIPTSISKKINEGNFEKVQTIREQVQNRKNQEQDNSKSRLTEKNESMINDSKLLLAKQDENNISVKQSPSRFKVALSKNKSTTGERKKIVDNALQGKISRLVPFQVQKKDIGIVSSQGKNYVLQSKISNQKLSIFQRIKFLLGIMVISVAYFLVIIIYINSNKTNLQEPIKNNQMTIQLHVNYVQYLISSELLAFDGYLQTVAYPLYTLNDLDKFYAQMKASQAKMEESITNITAVIYGDNPYNSTARQILKNFMQGNFCEYLTRYPCSSSNDKLAISRGVTAIVQSLIHLQTAFSEVLTPSLTPEALVRQYLNSNERISSLARGFQTQEEVLDLFSSNLNQAIGVVSNNIQSFLENLLSICGILLASIISLVLLYSWYTLSKNLQLMNLFLTLIPDEKLLEEVTLHMLKQLRKM